MVHAVLIHSLAAPQTLWLSRFYTAALAGPLRTAVERGLLARIAQVVSTGSVRFIINSITQYYCSDTLVLFFVSNMQTPYSLLKRIISIPPTLQTPLSYMHRVCVLKRRADAALKSYQ
jgi:hypothetical protein